jgi:hypothetical protein
MSFPWPYLSLSPPRTGRQLGTHLICTLVRKLNVQQKVQAEWAGCAIPITNTCNLQSMLDFPDLQQTKLPESVEFLISETSGFHRRVVDAFTALGCYAA